jgi:hypothetical protein
MEKSATGLLRPKRPRYRCAADKRDEVAAFQLIELHSFPASQGPLCRISNCKRSVSGHAGILQPLLVLPTLAATARYTFGTMNAQIERCSRPRPRHTWQWASWLGCTCSRLKKLPVGT